MAQENLSKVVQKYEGTGPGRVQAASLTRHRRPAPPEHDEPTTSAAARRSRSFQDPVHDSCHTLPVEGPGGDEAAQGSRFRTEAMRQRHEDRLLGTFANAGAGLELLPK